MWKGDSAIATTGCKLLMNFVKRRGCEREFNWLKLIQISCARWIKSQSTEINSESDCLQKIAGEKIFSPSNGKRIRRNPDQSAWHLCYAKYLDGFSSIMPANTCIGLLELQESEWICHKPPVSDFPPSLIPCFPENKTWSYFFSTPK